MTDDKKRTLPETWESLREQVYQHVGWASMCWVGGTGDSVFDQQEASKVAESLLRHISSLTNFESPRLGLATTTELQVELEARKLVGMEEWSWEPSEPLWSLVQEPWVGKEAIWVHRDNPNVFSTDRGDTYYDLTEPLDIDGNPIIHTAGEVNA